MQAIQGGYNEADIVELNKIQNNCCYYCGIYQEKLHIDHLVPVSRNGTNYIFNIVLCCRTYNSIKGKGTKARLWKCLCAKYGEEWIAERKQSVKAIDSMRRKLETYKLGLHKYGRYKFMRL